MGEGHQHYQHHQFLLHHPPAAAAAAAAAPSRSSRYGGLKGGGGEIVEVQGGHIVRSTGRKDRHSKVCTAKGPRDRRVRLSAHTAIQFYDVQDRLGYDRPSKAVDWLIKNAKAAIDELAELPPWHPTATSGAITSTADSSPSNPPPPTDQEGSDKTFQAVTTYGFSSSSFLPPSLDSDAIADTIKSFFPIGGGGGASSSSPPIGFQGYPSEQLSRQRSQVQDLRLSLQSFQDPILLHQNTAATSHHHQSSPAGEQTFFSSSSAPLVFDVSAGWSEHNPRMISWDAADTGGGGGGGSGYAFGLPQQGVVPLHPVLGQSSFFTQRGPLQSSNLPSSRAWMEQIAISTADHHTQGTPFGSAAGFMPSGFSGFRIPARIQGEEEHDGIADKPSSTPASRH